MLLQAQAQQQQLVVQVGPLPLRPSDFATASLPALVCPVLFGFGFVRFGSVSLGPVWFGSVRFGFGFGSVRFGSVDAQRGAIGAPGGPF